MNAKTLISCLAGSLMLLTGCQNPDGTYNNTGSGVLIGAGAGALTGAAVGGRNHGGQDALIGAAAGAVVGGVIGNSMDREQEARLRAQAPQTYVRVDQGQPLTVSDVKALARAGISEEVIISQINSTHTVFHLSAGEIIDLRDSGVPDRVINYMINTPSTAGSAAVVESSTVVVQQAPPPRPVETIVVAPGPGYVWIDGEWNWAGARWVWIGGHWMYPPHPHGVWVRGYTWHGPGGWHHERGHWR